MSHERTDVEWASLFSPSVDDPNPFLDELRSEGPVHSLGMLARAAGPPAFVSVCYRDVTRILGDESTFSSAIVGERYGPVLGQSSVVALDGMVHTQLRLHLASRLRPRALASYATDVLEALTDELLNTVSASSEPDLVADLAAQLPARVICRLLGLEEARFQDLSQLAGDLFQFVTDPKRGLRARRDLTRACRDEIDERRRSFPRDDILGELLSANFEGEPLSDELLVEILLLFIGAGTKTTGDALANALLTLLGNELMNSAASDTDMLQGCIDETLRLQSPAQVLARVATESTRIGGIEVPRGALVLAHIGSANRDDAAFQAAGTFKPQRRQDPPHLAFGWGTHRCPGLHLARMELETAIRAIAERLPDVTIDPREQTPRISGAMFRSVPTLRIRNVRSAS